MFMQIFVHSIIRYLVSSFTQTLDLSQLYHFSIFFFSFRVLVIRIPSAKITQLACLDLRSRDIDACAPLHSRENVVDKVISHFMPKITYTQISIVLQQENNIVHNLCYDVFNYVTDLSGHDLKLAMNTFDAFCFSFFFFSSSFLSLI